MKAAVETEEAGVHLISRVTWQELHIKSESFGNFDLPCVNAKLLAKLLLLFTLVTVLAVSMAPPPALTCEDLIELLEIERGAFTDVIQPLLALQEARLRKANDLISKNIDNLNDKQRKARYIFITLRDRICYEVFLLCALATTPSGLMFSKLGDYHEKIITWWTSAEHPRGLRDLASLRTETRIASFNELSSLQSRSIRCAF